MLQSDFSAPKPGDGPAQSARRPACIRVMLVDDHAVVRAGYRRLLELEPDVQVIGEHADADSAYAALLGGPGAGEPELEVLILDLSMPGRSGLDLLQRVRLRWPWLRVLIFTMHDAPALVGQCLRAGAHGFITKSSQPEELVAAVRAVLSRSPVLSADLLAQGDLGGSVGPDESPPPHEALSAREFDVFRYLITGEAVESIAQRLNLSAKTVANLQSLIRQKLGVANAMELLHYARAHRLLD